MSRLTCAEISVSALKNNLNLLQKWAGPGNFFCPMVKSNAYGHDDVLVSLICESEGVSAVGVARIEEGLHLRRHGLKLPILAFVPLQPDTAELAVAHGLTPVLGCPSDLDILGAMKLQKPLSVHLEFNTGMQRLGFDASDLPQLREALRRTPMVKVEGVCTHFVFGEEAADKNGQTMRQMRQFDELTEGLPGVRHAHKSASLIAMNESGQGVGSVGSRPGIALYGIPHEGSKLTPGLKPVLRWVSELATVHQIAAGETVSYGGRWKAARRSWIGVVPVGYGDGYMRCLSGRSQMLYQGQRVPVVGSVCMDYTLLDLTDVVKAVPPKAGEQVVVMGSPTRTDAVVDQTISPFELAQHAGTIAYEVVSNIRQRVPREAV